jgi:TIR domain
VSKSRSRSYDVFLSSVPADREEAIVVKSAIEDRGLSVFSSSETSMGADAENLIHSAISDARVLVSILSRVSVDSPDVLFVFGASWAWSKPIYLLLKQGMEREQLRAPYSRHPAFPLSNLSAAIDQVERAIKPIDQRQAKRLGELYASVGIPSDQLATRPAELARLTRRFNHEMGTTFSPESVLQEVIRLRKRGALPKLRQQAG